VWGFGDNKDWRSEASQGTSSLIDRNLGPALFHSES
jgi:hypothetical protein